MNPKDERANGNERRRCGTPPGDADSAGAPRQWRRAVGGGTPAGRTTWGRAAGRAAAGAAERPAVPQATPPTTTVVYAGTRLIAGNGAAPIEDSALVSGGVITAVGPRDAVDVPAGAMVVDATGKAIIPALVDLHGHVGFQRGLSYDVANHTRETSSITSIATPTTGSEPSGARQESWGSCRRGIERALIGR